MGPRAGPRGSPGSVEDGIGENTDSTPRDTASRMRELWRRRGMRLYLALLAAVSLSAAFLPLADHLGYELSELVALCAGSFGAAPGVAAARGELWRNEADALRAVGTAVLA